MKITREKAKQLLKKARARAEANGQQFDARSFLSKVKRKNEQVAANPERENAVNSERSFGGFNGILDNPIVEGLGTAGDFLGGIARTALAGTVGELGSDNNLVTGQDFLDAVNPFDRKDAVDSAEILRRARGETGLAGNLEGTDVAGFALDTLTDPLTFLSAGIVPAVKAIGKFGSVAGKATKSARLAEKLAVKALRPNKTQAKNIITRFGGDTTELGRELLDSGALKGSVVGGKKRILDNLTELDASEGKKLGSILNNIQSTAKNTGPFNTKINVNKLVNDTKKQALDFADEFADTATNKKKIDKILDGFVKKQGSSLDLVDANKVRSKVSNQIFKRKKDITKVGSFKTQVQELFESNLRNNIDNKAGSLAEKVLGQSDNKFVKQKRKVSKLKEARKVVADQVAGDASRSSLSLTGSLGGLGGLAVDGGASGIAGAIAGNAVSSGRAAAAGARGLDTVNNALSRLGGQGLLDSIAESGPSGINKLLNSILQRSAIDTADNN